MKNNSEVRKVYRYYCATPMDEYKAAIRTIVSTDAPWLERISH